MVQPFRFGVIAEHFRSAIDWSNLARRAEEYGYDSFLVPHHIFHAPFTLLTAAAAATTSLTVGASVFNIDILRDPVFLATEAASLDQLSNGRLELGLGFGYVREEYRQVGIPFEPTDTRIRRFQEALQVVKAYYQSDDPLRFDGTYYKIDYQMEKIRPFQQPHPPIYIGGGASVS
ncbi:LLM class flavin-dependent oxidoreductase [Ktedonosporobacter rubrisoli]|uniref:LLM class flavin-dependent oxidoreductase n=1 Tax=Ktedonosporobacter rubrisoli TaxID=2509675 RepID=A0A4P6K3M0_KTERU|nr:LLM class flavin-dependent oxidoreductase [Ktedonosporobacter rubrisoli]QBD82744.1 LLM class flavin-dependent oxidoreductase [Ktedonosporobacter rubrisoli]